MALRSLVGKLRVPPASVASRAFSQKCEHCGKISSGITSSFGQKNGSIKDSLEEEFRRCRRKEYIIRAITVLVTVTFSTCTVVGGIAYLENVENFRPKE